LVEEDYVDMRNEIMTQANFWASRVILTAAELDVFTHLDGRPMTSAECAQETGSDSRATDRLLNALVALDLLQKHGHVFSLSARGVFLSSKHPETVLPSLLHYAGLWESWSQLTAVVREGRPAKRTVRTMNDTSRRAFIGAMDVAGLKLSRQIADSFDATHFKRLLDIGGASGTYTIAFLRRYPSMTAVLFDLPPIVDIARQRIQAEGLADRVLLAPGDYNEDPLPSGCDVALLSAVIHQNSPVQNRDLFRKIQGALEPDGALLIRDFVMDPSRTAPKGGTLFALNMLVNTDAGDTYTIDEIGDSLRDVGFIDIQLLRGSNQQSDLVTARKRSE
jgi:SAM-dependent methyltransferase